MQYYVQLQVLLRCIALLDDVNIIFVDAGVEVDSEDHRASWSSNRSCYSVMLASTASEHCFAHKLLPSKVRRQPTGQKHPGQHMRLHLGIGFPHVKTSHAPQRLQTRLPGHPRLRDGSFSLGLRLPSQADQNKKRIKKHN